MKNKILLIGGAGFIGSALVKRFLKDENNEIYVLEPERANIDRLKIYENRIIIFQGDLRDSSKVSKILVDYNINIVIHLVATLIPGSSLSHFQNEMVEVLIPTMSLIKNCAENNIKFVYFSSGGTIYGNSKNGPHHEMDKKEPISYYGVSKNIVEEMIAFEHRHSNLEFLILRPSNPYGFGQNIYGKQGLIAVSIGKILKKEPIIVWGDGNSVRDYIYIDDLTDAVYQLLNYNISNEILNIGSGVGYTVRQIINMLDIIIDTDIIVDYVPGRDVDVDFLILDISKLKRLICFNPIDIKSGIKKFIDQIILK